jgi:hypothetical protein
MLRRMGLLTQLHAPGASAKRTKELEAVASARLSGLPPVVSLRAPGAPRRRRLQPAEAGARNFSVISAT